MRLKPGDEVKVIAPQPGAATAVHHVDGGHLAHRLDKDPVELRQELGHELGPFGRGRDRVAKEVAAAGQQRTDRRGVVALENQGLQIGQGHPYRRESRPLWVP